KEHNGGAKPKHLADVFGSRWLTAGMGSVVGLWVEKAGDPIVELNHLKQPAEEVGPFKVVHDHSRGRTTLFDSITLETALSTPGGVEVKEAARLVYATDSPTENDVERIRQRIKRLESSEAVKKVSGPGETARYELVGSEFDEPEPTWDEPE